MGRLGKALRLVARVTLVTVIALVVVPAVINVLTGGTTPAMLAPYTSWFGPALVVLVLIVVVLEVWEPLRKLFAPAWRDDPRNVPNALAQLQRYVKQRFHGSLAERVRVRLALEERPEAVLPPPNLVQRVGSEETSVPSGTEIVDVFDAMQHSMLITGAPGAGKTTLLLDLALALATRAANSANEATQPVVPVIVDLAEWSGVQRSRWSMLNALLNIRVRREARDFTSWLLSAVHRRYKIPSSVGRQWLEKGRLALLLDGLDEVPLDSRDRCVEEITTLQERYPATRQLAVCCREDDYRELAKPLRLLGAVRIRPLTHRQVLDYFAEAGLHGMAEVTAALEDDPELWELFTSPLMLNIMALAYGSRSAGVLTVAGSIAERRRQLFDAYLVEVLARRSAPRAPYTAEDTIHRLKTLASASIRLETGIAVRKPNLGDWSKVAPDRTAWHMVALMMPAASVSILSTIVFMVARPYGVLGALVVGVCIYFVLLFPLEAAPTRPRDVSKMRSIIAVGIALTCSGVFGIGLVVATTALPLLAKHLPSPLAVAIALVLLLVPTPGLMWLGKEKEHERQWIIWTAVVAGFILIFAVVLIWTSGLSAVLLNYGAGLLVGLAILPASMLSLWGTDRSKSTDPHSERRLKWLLVPIPLAMLVAAEAAGAPVIRSMFIISIPIGIVAATPLAWFVGLIMGMALQDLVAPVIQTIAGDAWVWRYRFLRFAADRSILIRTDGEFRFIHILIRDHLAACDPNALTYALNQRSAELLRATTAVS